MLKLHGVEAAMEKLKKHELLVKGKIADTKRNLIRAVMYDLILHSPQWSGNLASQWYVETNLNTNGAYRPLPGYMAPDMWRSTENPYVRGDDPALHMTASRELPGVSNIKWNTKVRIVNHAPYALEVENNIGPPGKSIREENQLASYGGVAMVGYVTMKYSNLRNIKRRIAP